MASERPELTFSERSGLKPVPPQLQLGEINKDLRLRLHYPIQLDFESCTRSGYESRWIEGRWLNILRDHWVYVRKNNVNMFSDRAGALEKFLQELFESGSLGIVFDFVEFVIQHPGAGDDLCSRLAKAFVDARAAYRILDGRTVSAVGTAEQAAAIERAVEDTITVAPGATSHLLKAASELRSGHWAASVRESIHAVESVAVRLTPSRDTLGAALTVLDDNGHLHGALKAAFSSLYGYASDEEGVRHALVFQDAAEVDEADALFMLGACASFVSYLVARGGAAPA